MCEENVKVEDTAVEAAENTEAVAETSEVKENAVEIEPLFEELLISILSANLISVWLR